jgi:outer membrane protein assembly factor BamA
MSGCIGTKHLQENQKLLYRQTIKHPKGFNSEGLHDLYVQKVNGRIRPTSISLPVGMYYMGKRRFNRDKFIARKTKAEAKFDRKIAATKNQKRIANLQYRKQNAVDAFNKKIENGNMFMQWGEPVTVFDTAAMHQSQLKIETALFNRGYFKVKVKADSMLLKKRRIAVIYSIIPGPSFIFDTIFYNIPDTHVSKLILKNQQSSYLKKGDQYNQDKLGKERDRIDLLLKDNGYFDFSKQFIDFAIDTSAKKNKIKLQLEILNPAKRGYHKQFRIDSVTFTPDAAVTSLENRKRTSKTYHNITFNSYQDLYSKKILAQRVFISKDSLYSRTQTFNTQRQLANLDNFKFVNLNYDTSGGRFIANLFTSPLDRYTWSNETGVTVTQGFPGPYVSTNFKKRNVFGGLEILELNGRFGFEGVAAATSEGGFYKSTEASGNISVTFPQFLYPFRSTTSFRYGRNNPRTKILGGYTYTDRPEYQRSITSLSATYTWDLQRRLQFSFSPATLNVINSTKSYAFDTLLIGLQKKGNNLINAFKPSYVSSMIFSLTWNNNYGVAQKSSTYIRTALESGGTLLNAYSPKFIQDQGLEPYQYFRFSFDLRKNVAISKTQALAYRFNTGFGYAYSSNKVLPYEKNFFIGGSNSIRAWRPRRLGLGSDQPLINTDPSARANSGYYNYRYEKPGQLLLEASIEWRQKLVGFLNYAVFIDAGNVWALQTSSNEASNFSWSRFYKEFGIGTGFGLRFDFTFLIVRFDVGVKAWDPARPAGSRFVLPNASFKKPYTFHEPVIYNIGIGYPF